MSRRESLPALRAVVGPDGDAPLAPRPPGTSPVGSPVGTADGPPSFLYRGH